MTEKRAIFLLLTAFFLLATAYSIVNPLHEATDELRHYRFVRYIVQEHALPVQSADQCSAQGHHPPLYYILAAAATFWVDTGRDVCTQPADNPFWAYRYWEVGRDNKNQYLHGSDEWWPWRGEALAAHLSRLVNVAVGTAVIYLTWLIGRTIWPQKPALAWGGAAIVAFNPMFLFMAGAINNDIMAALAGAAVTLGCVRLLHDDKGLSPRWGIVLGTLFGLALMSKFNLAAIALLVETAVCWVAWRKKQGWSLWLRVNLLIAVFTLLIAGWWFVRNQILYGEPTGFERLTELWGVRNPADSFWLAISELPYAWTSLWGRFGYGQIPLPDPVYSGLRWFVGLSLLGLLLLLRPPQRNEAKRVGPALLLQLLNVLLFFAVLFNYLLVSPAGPMGRFFFPALPSLALLTVYGLWQWGTLLDGKPHAKAQRREEEHAPFASLRLGVTFFANPSQLLVGLASAGLAVLALVALFGYLQPAYAWPERVDLGVGKETAVPNPINVQFDTLFRLRGYEIHQSEAEAGGFADVDLYWEVLNQPPGNFLMFLHLIDSVGTVAAQRDTHPGLGNYPTSLWQSGAQFKDSIRIYLPEGTYTPETVTLMLGFYAPVEGYRLGISAADGTGLGDALTLGQITIKPAAIAAAANYPNPLAQNFNNELLLQGYSYSTRQPLADNQLTITLYWQALPALSHDYIVTIELLDAAGQVQLTHRSRPAQEGSPTTQWVPNQHVKDQQLIDLHGIPPGIYSIHVALIDVESQTRQNIVGDDGRWINNYLALANVKVLASNQ